MAKRPATRDFPPECGSSSHRINPNPKGYYPEPKNAEDGDFGLFEKMGSPPNAKVTGKRSHFTRPRVPAFRDFPHSYGLNVHKGENKNDQDEPRTLLEPGFDGSVIKEKAEKLGEQRKVLPSIRMVSHGGKGSYVSGSSNQNKGKKIKDVAAFYSGNKSSKKEEKGSVDFHQNMQDISDVNVPLLDHDNNVEARNRVRATLRLFHAVCRVLMKEVKKIERGGGRIDVKAAKILKDNGKCINEGKHIIGPVPGIEVGDEFQFWKELNIVGLHRQILAGIDFVKQENGMVLATSVVSSGYYDDELDDTDVLIYTGQGGNVIKRNTDKGPEDQKLERGNLALKNSSEAKNPVRVILKSESKDGASKIYAYYGLYEVETYWKEMGPHGMKVFKFEMRRIPGQPEVPWKEVKKSEKFKTRKGLCVDDISYGKEPIAVCAINTIDDERPPKFEYLASMIYPDWCNPIPPAGCDCTSGCTDSDKCSCAVKNGGKIPFNLNRAIVAAKPKSIVSECGPNCKCPPTCHNRVSQHGIKFQLEIFKTKTKGWGVRSLNTIPSGSFICEYTGELLEDAEAEKRTNNDEYLFDIGNNHIDNTLCEELFNIMPDADSSSSQDFEDGGFTIDAAHYGNLGRFINHSCSPNLFTQNVLYDHDDTRIPHIMLFAGENIPRMQELTYHYNYKIDQVFDSDGNIKRKNCFCGALECSGRMY